MGILKGKNSFGQMVAWSWKEIVHGQLWPISVSITLIIASIFALTALAERLEQVVVKKGKEALSADSVFISANPIPQQLLKEVATDGLTSSKMTRFNTMAFSDDSMQLITVKAVDSNYPLLGSLVLGSDQNKRTSVSPNQLWMEQRLIEQLKVKPGDKISIGDADFVLSGQIVDEPGLSFNPFQQMPTAIIHRSDIDATGAIQTGSRVRYSLFLAGSESQLEQLKRSVSLGPSDRWRDTTSKSRTNEIFQRTEQYLSLTVAIVVIMAATTLILTCQHYVASRLKTIAMLKSLGASKNWVAKWLSIQVLILLLVAIVCGVLFGSIIEYLLRIPIADILPKPLPGYGLKPAILAISTSILIAVPALGIPLNRLLNVSALEVIQPSKTAPYRLLNIILIAVPVVPMLITYRDNILVWLVFGGIVALFVILAIASLLLTKILSGLPVSIPFKLAISRINRSKLASGVQFGALAVSLMMLGIIWLVRTDLLSDWNRVLPKNAPNAFAFNIAPYEKDAYLGVLDSSNIERSQAFPIIRGRLVKINGVDAKALTHNTEDTDALRRELNFTWATENPSYNKVLSGHWTENGGVSVESEVARALGLKIGDDLTFSINSQEFNAKINSIRQVEWRDMKPNFYFIFTPDILKDIPMSWLVSFRIDNAHNQLISQLSREYPTVSLMDIRLMGEKIRELLTQIILAISGLAALGVVAGLILIFTLLKLSVEMRQQEIQLYRTLGASKKRVVQTLWAEFGLMALISGFIATIAAEFVVKGIMLYGFEVHTAFHYQLWIVLPILTVFVLMLVVNGLIKRMLTPIQKS
ncbi:ABC transporter permease [Vibrio sp. S4M6]|uniref:ABC transporter permease n=1 Tax=Vibrio sinus TaxID=2946865 RepID=UPI002029F95A|nr:ABC transporter permease [Vibrio sinus]MCL9783196.1 ABC transporter permease [Vibrio sinus]